MAKGPEATVEAQCRDYAKSRGCPLLKVKAVGRVGCPDRLLLCPIVRPGRSGSLATFIEFKAPGKGPRPSQILVHQEMRREGIEVWVIDDPTVFRNRLEDLLRHAR